MKALFSCYQKDGIDIFAKFLVQKGYQIISTGGTSAYLKKYGISVTEISTLTEFPEILDGRVKTLHPIIHAGILARLDVESHVAQLKQHKIDTIDFVVCNLYPFEDTVTNSNSTEQEIIENIDIGGVTLIRAAAKNYQRVNIIVDNSDFEQVIKEMETSQFTSIQTRLRLARKAFNHTAYYDGVISAYFSSRLNSEKFPAHTSIPLKHVSELRYGENPHQAAALYSTGNHSNISVLNSELLGGKQLSYNNVVDADAAIDILREFANESQFCVIIKHTNPCGAALADDQSDAYQKALAGDPVSAFGGIVGFNKPLDKEVAQMIVERFYEIVIAPDYTFEALNILRTKKNLRILKLGNLSWEKQNVNYRRIEGGVLVQNWDDIGISREQFNTVTLKQPGELEADLRFAWRICKYVKSNAIVYAKGKQVIGVGAGQMSRVDAVRFAAIKSKEAGFSLKGAVMASDAFFPFRDSVDIAADNGIAAIIQPGGSLRDQQSIDAANQHGIAMVFTEVRHFRH